MDRQAYLESLPKKRMGAGVLIFNNQNELLLVKPNYKEGWILPGGTTEENESPKATCKREIMEEIGLRVEKLNFVCLDYVKTEEGENLEFVFNAGILKEQEISQIKPQETELTDFKFVKIEELENYLNIKSKKRIPKCVEALRKNISIYLENGEYV